MLQKSKKNSEQGLESKAYNYICKYCNATFVHETKYIKHHCASMKRTEMLDSPLGQAAYSFYEFWHKTNKRIIPPASTFLVSTVFSSFISFAKFVKATKIPNPKTYIKLMISKNILPNLWTNDNMYVLFLEYMDNVSDPQEHINITLKTMYHISEQADFDVQDFFNILTVGEIAQLVRQRKISPWVILHSRTFREFFINCNENDRTILETVIRPTFWKNKFENNPEGVKKVRKYLREAGI